MKDDTPTQSSDRLDQIIADYLQAEETGKAPPPEELLAIHPDLANELRGFFADRDRVHNLAAALPGEPQRKQFVPPKVRYFGDYELLDEIARGGMGIVYRARQTNLNRDVALKMILSGDLASEEDVKRFKTEAEAAANLQHPGIVPVHEVGQQEGHHYFSMDYIEGRSLAEIVRENPLPAQRAAQYVQAIAEAVDYAHGQGTLHRDLKPSNILIDTDDRVHVTDFGLAGRVDGDGDLTRTGQILGTPSYMPPEQAQGKRGLVSPASDVYSLGAILYELLTGRSPFRAESSIETLRQVIERDPISANTVNDRCKKARQFFASASEYDLIDSNPFSVLKGLTVRANPDRFAYVDRKTAMAVIDAATDAEFRLLIALCRFAGLRNPSETLSLRWCDVDRAELRMTVTSPKTEHHPGGESRTVPITPDLQSFIEEAWDAAPDGAEFVIESCRHAGKNFRTRMLRTIRRAGFKPWPKPFQNLRSSCQTDLEESFPSHVVCAWLGNSEKVAREHYLQVTDEHFKKAVQKAVQYPAEKGCETLHSSAAQDQKTREKSTFPQPQKDSQYTRRDSNNRLFPQEKCTRHAGHSTIHSNSF